MTALAPRSLLPLLLAVLLLGVAGLDAATAGDEADDEVHDRIFPLSAVRPGLRATVHTIFAGTRIETFEVEVLDVVNNFLSKQDVILVRCLGERVEHTGIAEGMSGSPVTIDGKIVGALAYTWDWIKDPIGGVTPIESMIEDGFRPLEGRPTGAEPPTLHRSPRPRPIRTPAGSGDLNPIATPLCVGGFSPEGRTRLAAALEEVGLPVRVGGGLLASPRPGWDKLDAPVVPGCAITVDLVRGDYSVAALGTCTYVDGKRLLAFGHGFQDVGETLLPVSVAYVYGVIPKHSLSFKVGAPIREIGALIRDQQSGVSCVLGAKAPMVPFHVKVTNKKTGRSDTFDYEITANRVFFQRLLLSTLGEAFAKGERTLGINTKRFRLRVKLKDVPDTWTFEDTIVSFDTGVTRLLITLVDRVLNATSQRAEFESIDLDIDIENVDRRAFIQRVTTSKDEVRPGEEIELLVRMRKREGGAFFFEKIPVRVPADVAEGEYQLVVTGGDNVGGEVPTPVDLLDIPALYDSFYKATELVAVLPTGRVNLDMDGRLLRNLPLSAVARLTRSPGAVQVKVTPVSEKVRRTVPYVVAGLGRVTLRVVR